MFLQLFFGIYKIQKESYVDEALWLYNRIPKFWQNIGERDWNGTRRSDKPGVTVMWITGVGLLNTNNLINCKNNCADTQKLENMLLGFRTTILFCAILFTPLLFFFLKKILGKNTAIFATIFVSLSPILLGISRLINPDSLLWIFSTATILSYLTYFKHQDNKFLYLSGMFMGLAIATKYVSNILYIFILLLPFLNYIFSKKEISKKTKEYLQKELISYLKFVIISIATFSLIYPAVWVKTSRIFKATIFSQAFSSTWQYFVGLIIFLFFDNFVLKGYIFDKILIFLKKYKVLIAKMISTIFVFFIVFAFINIFLRNPLFDFGNVLASPKSSYGQLKNAFFFYLTNFYPLLFGISPLALLLIIWNFLKIIFTRKLKISQNQKIFIYFSIFILLYFFASLFSKVSGTIRYQIILYPLILIMAGVSLSNILKMLEGSVKKYLVFVFLLIALIAPLYKIKPYYMSYVSNLLPEKYFLDHKDMGSGSYEAAQYLNSLPDAKYLNIWSDKKGVCVFFVGNCYSRFKEKKLREFDFDYYIVSSGRKNLVTRKINYSLSHGNKTVPRIDKLYLQNNYNYIINLGNRKNNFVKIFEKTKVLRGNQK